MRSGWFAHLACCSCIAHAISSALDKHLALAHSCGGGAAAGQAESTSSSAIGRHLALAHSAHATCSNALDVSLARIHLRTLEAAAHL